MNQKYVDLLLTWCDGLIQRQIPKTADGAGGFFCPACQLVHGRSGDAVYPLMAAYAYTGRDAYRQAALDVFDWSEAHVSLLDGSWANEATGTPWKGITCFSTIALGEALRLHESSLAPDVVASWKQRLAKAADFLLDFMQPSVGNINYPLSTAASLASAWSVLGDERYADRARTLAKLANDHLTPEGFIWGEGKRGETDISARGLRAIDLAYNVAETLPNLALYANLLGDEEMRELIAQSYRTHNAFMLPDGGWDAGWATRQSKWCYWGSRTTDGCASGLVSVQDKDPGFFAAALRSLDLMAACTYDGLLYAGPHVHAHGLRPCIHHTFVAARGLATALAADEAMHSPSVTTELKPLEPADTTHVTVREFADIATLLITSKSWHASITAYDFLYSDSLSHHPSGGALTMLWHKAAGPIAVASMNRYIPVEPTNMAAASIPNDMFPLTPRLETRIENVVYSNVYDLAAIMAYDTSDGQARITIYGRLCDENGADPSTGTVPYRLIYDFAEEEFNMTAQVEAAVESTLIFPVVSLANEAIESTVDNIRIEKPESEVLIATSGALGVSEQRVYNHVPGVEAIVLSVRVEPNIATKLGIRVSPTI